MSRKHRKNKAEYQRPQFEELEPRILYSADLSPQADAAEVVMVEETVAEEPTTETDAVYSVLTQEEIENHEAAASEPLTLDEGEHTETTANQSEHRLELIFIDDSIVDPDAFLNDLNDNETTNYEAITLRSDLDGFEQVLNTVSQYENIDAIHFVTHGNDASFKLGDIWVNHQNLNEFEDEFRALGLSLSQQADLLFYGCDIAESETGQSLIDSISEWTNADVAASTDLTGATQHHADWELEYIIGPVETPIAFSTELQSEWSGVLNTYTVTNTNDSGAGSLRQAILDANANGGADSITFSLGAGVSTINLSSQLPDITDTASIDGSQSGTPSVVLNGGNSIAYGLTLNGGSDGSTVRGLVIQNFTNSGINIGSSNNTIVGNYIGTNSTGTTAAGNGNGINVWSGSNNTIGGNTSADRNIVSGNGNNGIVISGTSDATVVQGNYIGTDVNGTNSIRNNNQGIWSDSDNGIYGGTGTGEGNLISGNGNGITLSGDSNTLQGNLIGTDATGTADLGNVWAGIYINGGHNNQIGGSTAAERNIISGNDIEGVRLTASGTGNLIQGNYIGTDITGSSDLGNTGAGINVESTSTNNTIGGSNAGEGNVVSGNDSYGIILSWSDNNTIQGNIVGLAANGTSLIGNLNQGIRLSFSNSNSIGGNTANSRNIISDNNGVGLYIEGNNNTVQGNYIGTDNTGLLNRFNNGIGLHLSSGTGNTIGGSGAGEGNVIGWNASDGIQMGSGADNNTIQGNNIGVGADGTTDIGNNTRGIALFSGASSNLIGGTNAGEGNIVAYHNSKGVLVSGSASTNNALLGNQIYANSDIGIDLDTDMVTANDATDADIGGNNLQNYPVLNSALINGGNVQIVGSLNSTANTDYRIEFFASTSADPTGHGEAERHLGSVSVTTDAAGHASIFAVYVTAVANGEFITATATVDLGGGNYGDTSEFAANVVASDNHTPSDITTTQTSNGGLSINLDGGNDIYLHADDAPFSGQTEITIEASFAISSPASGLTTLVSYAEGSNDEALGLFITNDGTLWFTADSNGTPYQNTSSQYAQLLDGKRHHVAASWDASSGAVVFYVDGAQVESFTGYQTGRNIAGGGELVIGMDQDSILGGFATTDVFSGTLYNIRIFDDVRTDAEIATSYRSALPFDEANLLANWTFDNLSSNGVITDTFSGNNLTVQHASGAGFTASTPALTLEVNENALSGTVAGTITGTDAEREALIASLLAADSDLIYSAETGKFYKPVWGSINWSSASTAAQTTSLNSVNGQLATIRSATEQEVAASISASGELWIGATDETVEGEHRWVENGTEADQFWSGDETGHSVNGAYSNWLSGRPDNTGGSQHYTYMRTDGYWNEEDASHTANGYLVEWDADDVLNATENLSYTIQSQTVADAFDIDSATGQITVKDGSLLDYETNATHTVTIRVTDNDSNTFDKTFTVQLNDLVEPASAPIDLSSGIELNTDGGNDAYLITTNAQTLLGGTTNITLETLFAGERSSDNTSYTLFSYETSTQANAFLVYILETGEVGTHVNNTQTLFNASDYASQLLDGNSHHIAVSWDNSNGDLFLYIDGELAESASGVQSSSALSNDVTSAITLGNEQDGFNTGYDNASEFIGTFYDIRIWDEVRSAEEIALNYQHIFDTSNLPTGLIANWQMDGFNGSNEVVDVVSANNLSISHAAGAGFITSTPVVDLQVDENVPDGTSVGFVLPSDPELPEDIVSDGLFLEASTPTTYTRYVTGQNVGDWYVENGSAIDLLNANGTYSGETPLGGNSLHLNGAQQAVVSQTLTTEVGMEYQIVFSLSGEFASDLSTKHLRVSAGGISADFSIEQPADWNFADNLSWETRSFTFTADSTSTELLFTSLESGYGPIIADVQVVEVPQAVSAILNSDSTLNYDAATGKFYRPVNSFVTWSAAQTAATSATLNGVSGQLVTIMSEYENQLVTGMRNWVWLGASDQNTEGEWRWYDGSEEGEQFWSGDHTGSAVNDLYSNWDATEPNNSGGTEHYAYMTPDGRWNDYTGAGTQSYIIEWDATEVLSNYTFALTDDASGAFAIDSNTGEITVADTSQINYESAPSLNITVEVTDAAGQSYSEVMTIAINNQGGEPTHNLPGSQSVDEDNTLTFSSGGGNAITVSDTGANDELLQVTLNSTNGTLSLSQTTGLTLVGGSYDSDHMVINGTESDINAALDGSVFTPDADFSGAANVQVKTAQANALEGDYSFEAGNAIDDSVGVSQDGTLMGNASIITDGTRGNVLSLDGDADYVIMPDNLGDPTSLTLGAWVNLTAPDASGAELFSLGSNVLLRLDRSAGGIRGSFHNGTGFQTTDTDLTLAGTGWHHIAYTIDNSTQTQTLYIDGTAVATTHHASSVAYPNGGSLHLGKHPSNSNYDFNGLVDDARIYSRALSADEIAALATDQTSITGNIAITVNPINDPPVAADDRHGVYFDGVEDHISMGNDSSLVMTSTMTIELWVKPDESATSSQVLINKEGEYEIGLVNNNEIRWAFDNTDPDWNWYDTGATLEIGEWSHLAITYDNGDVTTYVNGVQVDFYDGSGAIGDQYPLLNDLVLGGRTNNPTGQYFDGSIAEVRLWDTARTAGDISSNMNVTLTGAEANLASYWKLNESTGTTATDSAGSNDGTLTSGAAFVGHRVTENGLIAVGIPGVLNNDTDKESGLTVSEVEGSAANVGNQITLASGALLTLNADGSFNYDTNGAFDSLTAGETTTDSFVYTASDGSLTDTATVTILIEGLNDAPAGSNGNIAVTQDTAYTFDQSDFGYSDVEGDNFVSVTITTLPAQGTLKLSGVAITAGDSISVADIDADLLTYEPPAGVNGNGYSSFTFQVQDDGGTANGSVDLDATPNTLTIDIAVAYRIDGTIYEDVNGDASLADGVGVSGVTVYLYRDVDDDLLVSAGDTLVTSTTTDGSGNYSFLGLADDTYFVVVDSKTITPAAGLNGGFDATDIWAEQTYGVAGALAADGAGGTRTLLASGAVFGGKVGDVSDDASSLLTAEHVTAVTLGAADASNIDSGFSFNVVTGVRDGDDVGAEDRSIQGSLRQFTDNADAITGSNAMRFVPVVGTNTTDGSGGNWWSIQLASGLTSLTDDGTSIDGTAYDWNDGTSVLDSNAKTFGTGGTVGIGADGIQGTGDDPTLALFQATELEIIGVANTSNVLSVLGNNFSFDDLAIRKLSDGSTGSGIVNVTGDNASIENVLFGVSADGTNYNATGTAGTFLTVSTSNSGDITHNYFSVADSDVVNALNLTGSDTYLATQNEIVGGFKFGLSAYANNATVSENFVEGVVSGFGIGTFYGPYTNLIIENNTVQNSTGYASIAAGFGSSDITIRYNYLHSNTSNISIRADGGGYDDAQNIVVSMNAMHDNGNDGIVTTGAGVNDGILIATDPNQGLDHPIITQANLVATNLSLAGYVGSAPGQATFANARVEFFVSDGSGEGQIYLGFLTTDASGNFSGTLSVSGVSDSDQIVATATLTAVGTSEFGTEFDVNVTPTLITLSNNTVAENTDTSGGHSVGTLTTTDADTGDSQTYTIVGGADSGVFSIGGAGSDELIIDDGLLDFESQSSYAVIVRITDSGGLTYDDSFTINVTDANDAPVNTVPGAQVVNEDTSLSISGISVADEDNNLSTVQLSVSNGTLNVTLQGAASISAGSNGSTDLTLSGSLADINNTLTSLSYQGNLNFNGADTLTVLSTDSNTATDFDTVAITINAVNDVPVITSNGGLATASISVAENQTAVTTVSATDVDLDSVSFSITGGVDSALFTINASGVLTFASAPDFDAPADSDTNNVYEVEVTADDGNGGTDVQILSVTVLPALTANTDNVTLHTGVPVTIDPLANDTDPEGDPMSVTQIIDTANANATTILTSAGDTATLISGTTIELRADGRLKVIGAAAGAESFDYTVDDGNGNTATGTVNLTLGNDEATALATGFVTSWDTTQAGVSASDTITIPVGSGDTEFTVYWGDGSSSTHTSGPVSHTYTTAGTYTVAIVGDFPGINFNGGGDGDKLMSVEQWGNIAWQDLDNAFDGAENLVINASDAPDLSGVTTLFEMFRDATSVNADLSSWDVSSVTTMFSMFRGATSFNQDIGTWNTSNVTSMGNMFYGASAFNQNLDSWNTSAVTNMTNMFRGASAFNGSIGTWDTSNVSSMSGMFNGASAFNQDISSWDTSSNTSMYSMFYNASSFNQALNSWDTSAVTSMFSVFRGATSFNQDIGAWDTSNVTNMSNAFYDASVFNQNLDSWNTANVTDMGGMFYAASAFNQSLNSWNTASVNNMRSMFAFASAFDGDISTWTTGNVTDMAYMFREADAFNQSIGAWDTGSVTNMSYMFNGAETFNQDIGTWNTANVTTLRSMFLNATSFNQDIGAWNTGSVTDMSYMFQTASSFNQDISLWNTANVTTMSFMFRNAYAFDQAIGVWDVSSVTDMSSMFRNASNFNQNIGAWDVSSVANMYSMFNLATSFNQDIGTWNTANVTNMGSLFNGASDFNQNIGAWDTSSVTNMLHMFYMANSFNQDIGSWNTSGVTDMGFMFRNAYAFNQDIGNWDISSVTNMSSMLDNTNVSVNNYDAILSGFAGQLVQSGVTFGVNGLQYSAAAATERQSLIDDDSWIIIGDGYSNSVPVITSDGGAATASINAAENQTSVTTLTSSDADLDTVTYAITGGADSSLFGIDSNSGVLTFNSARDFEAATDNNADGIYEVEITADDGNGGTDVQTLSVTITDVNESPTVATNTGITVAEASTGNTITTAMLNEGDMDDTGIGLTYTITTDVVNGTLRLSGSAIGLNDTFTQADIDAGLLTYDHNGSETSSDNFSFSLSDGDEDGATDASGTFNVTVTNVNDAPVNTVPGAQLLSEDTSLTISGISVADADDNLSGVQLSVSNGTLNVTLQGAASVSSGSNGSADLTLSGSLADINATLATLSYQGNLHFNGADTLTVLSTDSDSATDSDTVGITVTAVNDEQSLDTNAGLSLNEGATATITNAMLATSDVDNTAAQLTYTVTTAPGNGQLELTTGPGVGITSFTQDDIDNNRLVYVHDDTETTSDSFDFSVDDGTGVASTGTFAISVTLHNENAPVITAAQSFSVSELAANGFSLGNAVATDVDTGTTLSSWTITSGNTDSIFAINSATGEITVADNTNLDFDATSSYTLSLTVSDGTNTSAVETVTINVTDVTTAITAAQSFSITENVNNGDAVGSVLTTGDTPKTFNITGGNTGSAFAIDNSGNITIADSSAIDYETLNSYTLSIQASDGTTPVSETVTVTLTDVNESAISAISDSNAALDSVAENVVIGTAVGITALASDSDGTDTVTYTLTDDAGGRFVIDSNTGIVTVAGPINYEQQTSHNITVVATSDDGSTSSQTFSISVNNVNDTAPSLSDNTVSLAENATAGSVLIDLNEVNTGTDQDVENDALSYSIIAGNTDGLFAIDVATGVVTLVDTTVLNYETNNLYVLDIQATDGLFTTTTQLTIQIQNVNEAPVIDLGSNLTVDEDNPLTINDLSVGDPDSGNTDIEVTITATNGVMTLGDQSTLSSIPVADGLDHFVLRGSVTAINQALAGLIYNPDENFNGVATLTVVADDLGNTGSGSPLSETESFTITVVPVNDMPELETPELVEILPGESIDFSTALNNLEPLQDLDSQNTTHNLSMSIDNASLSIADTSLSGHILSNTGGTLEASGDLATINQILNALVIIPDTGYFGELTLNLTVEDEGSSDVGASRSISAQIHLFIPTPVIPPEEIETNNDTEPSDDSSDSPALVEYSQIEIEKKEKTIADNVSFAPIPVVDFQLGAQGEILAEEHRYDSDYLNQNAEELQLSNISSTPLKFNGLNWKLQAYDIELVEPLKFSTPLQGFLEFSDEDSNTQEISLGIRLAEITGAGFVVGSVVWLLKGSSLLSSLLVSYPAWRGMDPLPVLLPRDSKPAYMQPKNKNQEKPKNPRFALVEANPPQERHL